jgi:hypothetical protein
MKKTGLTSILALGLSLVSGCSALYTGQQSSARKACETLAGIEERIACRQQNSMSYEQYEKQRQALHDNDPQHRPPGKSPPAQCFKRESTGETVCPN